MDADWVAVVIAALVAVGGLAVNLFVIGRFIGQWGEAMRHITAALAKVETRMEEVGDQGDATVKAVDLLDARVRSTEEAAGKFWEMRDAFIRMTTTIELTGKQQQEQFDRLARGQSVIERQLANMVSGRGGALTMISSEDQRG